jgi:formate hydrogenlyase subunit 6/NADH:ubiquinone oxidoreductase subunit I
MACTYCPHNLCSQKALAEHEQLPMHQQRHADWEATQPTMEQLSEAWQRMIARGQQQQQA